MKAIDLLEGDTLKKGGSDTTPTEFSATMESKTILYTFQRAKP